MEALQTRTRWVLRLHTTANSLSLIWREKQKQSATCLSQTEVQTKIKLAFIKPPSPTRLDSPGPTWTHLDSPGFKPTSPQNKLSSSCAAFTFPSSPGFSMSQITADYSRLTFFRQSLIFTHRKDWNQVFSWDSGFRCNRIVSSPAVTANKMSFINKRFNPFLSFSVYLVNNQIKLDKN